MRNALSAIFLKRADGNTIAGNEFTDNGTTSDGGQIVCVSGSEGNTGTNAINGSASGLPLICR